MIYWLRRANWPEHLAGLRPARRASAGPSAPPTTPCSTAWRKTAPICWWESGSGESRPAWYQAYRALEHGRAKQRADQDRLRRFPQEIQDFAKWFAEMQERRQTADYDPSGSFVQSAVIEDIDLAELRIRDFRQAPERDRRAFAVYVLLILRND